MSEFCEVNAKKNIIEDVSIFQGDSGGPLFMRYIIEGQKKSAYHDNSKPWYLLGIVSFGTKTCGTGNPSIYTRWMNGQSAILQYGPTSGKTTYFVTF